MCILPGNSDSIICLEMLAISNLEVWPYVEYSNEQVVSATPL